MTINPDYLMITVFLAVFGLLALLEAAHPRRRMDQPRTGRWFSNLTLAFTDVFLVRFILGAAALGAAQYASDRGWGFLNDVELSFPVEALLGFLFLDFMVYLQHVVSHALPFLWRFHMVHHSDLEFDVTTAFRFHPVEVLIVMFYKIMVVTATGIDPRTMAAYELAYIAATLFNHANYKLAPPLDARLRRVIVTPDFHRVHHSIEPEEANSNFGFCLPWWDVLFGTHRPQPAMPHNVMQLGVSEYREAEELSLFSLLILPFNPRIGNYSFGKGEE